MANVTELLMQLKLRRDNVFKAEYVLGEGEPGFEVSTNTLKIGDGVKTWAQLDIANKAAIDTLIKVVDDKVVALTEVVNGLDTDYVTEGELTAAKEALQGAIDLKLDITTFNNYTATRQLTDTEINTAFGDVDAKFDTITTDQLEVDTEQNRRLSLIESDYLKAENIVDFETKENVQRVADDLANVKKTADAAAVKDDVDAALAERYTKTEANNKFETIANVDLVRADITNITKEGDGLIAKAIATAKTETETQISTFKTTVTDVLDGRIEDVEDQLANVSNVMDFVGAGANLPAAESSNKGDVFVINEGDNAGKEYVFDGTTWVEFGYATGNENAIAALQDRMDAAEEDVADHESRLGAIEPKVAGWDTTKSTVDSNKATWDLAGTAVQSSDFETFKGQNDQAIADAKSGAEKTASDALAAALENYYDKEAANEYISNELGGLYDTMQEYTENAVKYLKDNDVKANADAIAAINDETDGILAQAKAYADSVGADVDTGVMSVEAGNDIVVTPGENGKVTVAHEEFTTGEYTRDPATSDKTGDQYFFTGVTVDNGHVTGANVKSLASVLEGMRFILDGGTSGAN